MIQAILFDFDGTLARYRGNFPELLDSLRAELMLTQCDLNAFRRILSGELLRGGEVTLQSALLSTFEQLELHPGPDLEIVAAQALVDYGRQVELLPGARELLESLRGRVPLALVSNGPEDMQRAALDKLGIAEYFDAVLISGAAGVAVRKPSRRIFELACRRLGVSPADALMVGDNLEADIAGASACGLQVLHLADPGSALDGGTELRRVCDLHELREALEHWLES